MVDRDRPAARTGRALLANRVRGVDDQVQDRERQITRVAQDPWHIAELGDDIGIVLVFVARELERGFDLLVDIHGHEALAIAQVGVRANALDDPRDPSETGARVLDGTRDLGEGRGPAERVGADARDFAVELVAGELAEQPALDFERVAERCDAGSTRYSRFELANCVGVLISCASPAAS